MVNVWLLTQRTKKFELHNNLPSTENDGEHLEIGLRYNFHIEYATDKTHCKATLVQVAEVIDDPKVFHISATIEGIFETDPILDDEVKPEIHIRCYCALFPYAQSLISQMSLATGIAPIISPIDHMRPEDISIKK